jgi:hypothetical protein
MKRTSLVLFVLLMSFNARAALIYLSDECNCSNYQTDHRYGVLDTSTGDFTVLSTSASEYYGLAYSSSGVLYGSTANSLDILNPGDGSVVSTVASGEYSLASSVGGGALYDVSGNDLYMVNPDNGAQTLVGSLGISLDGDDWSIAFGPDNA